VRGFLGIIIYTITNYNKNMFKFKLQPVLRYRKRIEEKFQIELGKIKIRYKEEKKKLYLLMQNKDECEREICSKYRKGIKLSDIILYFNFINKVKMDIDKQESVLKELKMKIEEKRKELLKASKERKIIEKLREKKEREYLEDLNRKERIFLDEISTNRFIREALTNTQ